MINCIKIIVKLIKKSFVDLLCFCSVFCLLCLCARLFICALWSLAGKGLTSWLSFVVSTMSLSLSHWYPGSGVILIVSIPDLCTLTYFFQHFDADFLWKVSLKILNSGLILKTFTNDCSRSCSAHFFLYH